jgi:peptide/nickel transport system permease protein
MMVVFVLRRLSRGLVTLLVVSLLVFVATNLLPGDPATAILGKQATPERLTDLRKSLNLDEPVATRYAAWLGGVIQGDFGRSITQGVDNFGDPDVEGSGTPVTTLIGRPLLNTAVLASISFVLLVLASLFVGTVAALRRGSSLDTTSQVLILVLIALPEFVLGSILVIGFAFIWPVAPAVTLEVSAKGLILPIATLVLGFLGVTARLVRVGVIEVLDSNYVTNARLRGVPESRIIRSHVLPNALGPTLQVFAIATGIFVGGVVVVEYLFGYPGLGTGFVSAVAGRDYPVVQAYTLIFAAVYVVANIGADAITIGVNPRLREAVAA